MKEKENIDKILKDILSLEPELKSDKKRLKKVIKTLSDINPNFKSSKEFKKKLKNRITSLIELKSKIKPKTNYMYLIAYIFSGLFAAFGFFYMFSDNLFIGKDFGIQFEKSKIKKDIYNDNNIINKNINVLEKEKYSNINIKGNKETNENKIYKKEEEAVNHTIKGTSPKQIKEKVEIKGEEKVNTTVEDFDNINLKVNKSRQIIKEEDKKSNVDKIDGDIYIDTSNLSDEEIEDIDLISNDQADDSVGGFGVSSMSVMENSELNEQSLNSFSVYCSNIGGDFINNNGVNICTLSEKQCNEEEYNLGNCDEIFGIDDIDINLEELFKEFSEGEFFE